MTFLCLGYLDIARFDALPDTVKGEVLARCGDLLGPFRATGKVTMEYGLVAPSEARSIRPSASGPVVTEGAFVDSPLQLGAFFIVEADSLEEAVAVASLHPAAQLGGEYGFGIEVRPVQG
ncbi:MAG: hypothetical protein JST35_07000 [Armatimonadetes bacterium]|nr:hypothetical protein [Armatimonadota bacterium]